MHTPFHSREKIAEEALGNSLSALCRGSWEGVARGVAWQVASAYTRDLRSIETLAEAAEEIFTALIDEALWTVERTVAQTWDEFLELRPGDAEGALAAARLDAAEESAQLVESARDQVFEALVASIRDAA